MDWTEIKITVNADDVDRAGDIAQMVVPYESTLSMRICWQRTEPRALCISIFRPRKIPQRRFRF